MKVVWFNNSLIQSGGGERLGLESVRSFRALGIDASYLSFNFLQSAVFDGRYSDVPIMSRRDGKPEKRTVKTDILTRLSGFFRDLNDLLWLRKQLKEINPDHVITQGTWNQVTYVFLATIGTGIPFSVHIFGSIFAFAPSHEITKYALVFRRNFNEVRNSMESYRELVPLKMPPLGLLSRVKNEVATYLKYLAVRNAQQIFVLSRRNQWEVEKLYGRKSLVLKGAFPLSMLDYSAVTDIKQQMKIENKRMILSVCRLAVNKRVDLCIKAFAILASRMDDLILVIGGTGPEEASLRKLVQELKIDDKVMFIGYVQDDDLWDYICACDVFVSLDLADFDIAPFEALALRRKVVWADEMEMDDVLLGSKYLYSAEPTPICISNTIENAIICNLSSEDETDIKHRLESYSWEQYADDMLSLCYNRKL